MIAGNPFDRRWTNYQNLAHPSLQALRFPQPLFSAESAGRRDWAFSRREAFAIVLQLVGFRAPA